MKLPNFMSPFTDSLSKIEIITKCAPKQLFFNEKKSERFE